MTTRRPPTGRFRREEPRSAVTASAGVGSDATDDGVHAGPVNVPDTVLADGEVWRTEETWTVGQPEGDVEPNALYVVTNSSALTGQPPVGGAAPGNPEYGDGLWQVNTVAWTQAALAATDAVPVLTREGPTDHPESIGYHADRGHLRITRGSPVGGPPTRFRCRLLPEEA